MYIRPTSYFYPSPQTELKSSQNYHPCHCNIVPPQMADKIIEANKNPELKKIAQENLNKHRHIREKRAKHSLIGKKVSLTDRIKIYDAKNGDFLPGSRIISP